MPSWSLTCGSTEPDRTCAPKLERFKPCRRRPRSCPSGTLTALQPVRDTSNPFPVFSLNTLLPLPSSLSNRCLHDDLRQALASLPNAPEIVSSISFWFAKQTLEKHHLQISCFHCHRCSLIETLASNRSDLVCFRTPTRSVDMEMIVKATRHFQSDRPSCSCPETNQFAFRNLENLRLTTRFTLPMRTNRQVKRKVTTRTCT
jgi:hypothetical protein